MTSANKSTTLVDVAQTSSGSGATVIIGVVLIILFVLVVVLRGASLFNLGTGQNYTLIDQSATESVNWMRANYRSTISISNMGPSGVDQFNQALTKFQISNNSSRSIPLRTTLNCNFANKTLDSQVEFIEPSGSLEILCNYDSSMPNDVCVDVGFTNHFYGESSTICYSP